MQATRRLLGPPGIIQRSLEEAKRFVQIATRLEAITGPTRPYDLAVFKDKDAVEGVKTMSDADMGGFSSASFDFVPAQGTEPAHARFHGKISLDLPPNKPHIVRSGYAGWATYDRKPTFFGRGFWDIDPYTHLCMKVNTDGRKYFVNVRTDSIVPTDIHQHRLPARQPGQWETIAINLNDFVRTNHGEVVEPQSEMLRDRVKSVGISVLDRIPKPFELKVARVWVTNFRGDDEFNINEDEIEEEAMRRRAKFRGDEKIMI